MPKDPKTSMFSKDTLMPVGLVIIIVAFVVGLSTQVSSADEQATDNEKAIVEVVSDLDELQKEYYQSMIKIEGSLSSIETALETLINSR